ncbi:S49 family peptidase [Pirellulimonas nuda]|uniref:S49 family peptidase n=1 Tax=Pirellulimonas nuda TaxID=2528009 RepID=UPI0018D37E13|nr:S49 family peptidase [Pirellulimonas nuda]
MLDRNVRPVNAYVLAGSRWQARKVAVIDVDGLLVNGNLTGPQSMGENPVSLFREKLDAADADPCVVAVVLRINSPGGSVAATDMMRHDLVEFRRRTGRPVVACLMDVGAGGAYYLASAADAVYAGPSTVTGGLGVILNLYDLEKVDVDEEDNSGQLALELPPVAQRAIRSGEMVDMGSPLRGLESQEQKVLEGIASEYHHLLRSTIVESRPQIVEQLPGGRPRNPQETNATAFAGTVFDGRVFTTEQAIEQGLVDHVGYLDEAIAAAKQLGGVSEAKTVMYRRSNDRALTSYDITQNTPGTGASPLSIPGSQRAELPLFLYLWQPEPLYEKNGGP